jgi:hypothetical protein
MKKSVLIWAAIIVSILQVGCGANLVRYVMDEPPFTDIEVKGIDNEDQIIEVSDAYKNQVNDDGTFWCVVYKDGNYQLGKLNVETGEIKDLSPLSETDYSEEQSIYWDSFNEEGMGGGEACIGACLSQTAFGGTTDKYGLNAQKNIWGNPENTVKVSYQYTQEQSTSTYYTTTSWQSGATQTFSKNDKVATINVSDGYVHAFNLRAGKYARYYPIDDNNYLGLQEQNKDGENMLYVITYLLNFNDESANQKSFGARLENLDGIYVDGCVTRDGKIACIILKKGYDKYIIQRANTKDLVKNVKMFRTIQ